MSSSIQFPGSTAACRHDQACIDRKPFPADQSSCNTGLNNALEYPAEHVVLAKPLMTDTRERRMVRHLVLNRKPAKPTIGKVHLNITA
jgi:hypothetical protein